MRRRPVTVELDVNSPAARALRALQRLDEAAELGEHRDLLLEAETLLGLHLGLQCSGHRDGPGPYRYDHNDGTCPVHEWVEPADSTGQRAW